MQGAIDLFSEDPTSALALIKSHSDYIYNHEEKHKVVMKKKLESCLRQRESEFSMYMPFVAGWMCSVSQKKF